jgi:3-oxoacyl-[acyl-carrier protein] reductase
MDLDLRDKVVFVAGSSRGIGRTIAKGFLREGARVAISGRNRDELAQVEKEFHAECEGAETLSFAGDLTKEDVIREALAAVSQRWNRPDILVANIGSGRGKAGWRVSSDEWLRLWEVNFFGAVRLVTEALPAMIEKKRGAVVLIGSITGLESTAAPLAYSSAKAALLSYTKNLAREVASEGVRVNAVAPGNVFFPGGSWEKHLETRRDEVMRYIESEVPLKRFGKPEEIADVVLFLSSPRASFVTGACVVVDGGQTRSL